MLSVIRAGLVSHPFYHPRPYTRVLFLSMLNSCCPERTDKHKIYSIVFIVWEVKFIEKLKKDAHLFGLSAFWKWWLPYARSSTSNRWILRPKRSQDCWLLIQTSFFQKLVLCWGLNFALPQQVLSREIQANFEKAYWKLESKLNSNDKELAAATLWSIALNYSECKGNTEGLETRTSLRSHENPQEEVSHASNTDRKSVV